MNTRTRFKLPSLHVLAAGLTLFIISGTNFAAVDAPYEVGTWANFCQGAVSHTFDDNTAGQTSTAQPLFDEKKFHMTLFTVSSSMNPNWTNLKKAFEKGHEIASHSVTHGGTMPDAECPTSQKAIQQNVPGEKCITIAYPNCNIPNPQTELKKCYVAGRICDNQIASKTPADFYRVVSMMGGTAGTNTASGFNSKADEAATKGGWLVWCHHGVGNDGHGYSNTATDALKGNITYLDQNRAKIWTAAFGEVARYIKERDAASVTKKDSTDNGITISVTDNLPDSIYNYPLSIRRPLPSGWTTAVVTQKGKAVDDSIITVNSKQYVMFQAIPDGGDVVISKSGTAVIHRSSTRIDDGIAPVTRQKSTLIIDARRFNGEGTTVTLFDLTGKVLSRYALHAGETSVELSPIGITTTAFIATIRGNGTTWSGMFMPQM
jgi:oligosaccharide reducing-end xylanase